MPQGKTWYLIAYDVRDDRRLRKVLKKVEGYGYRLQYSVYRCRLTRRELERLNWELKKIMALEDDLLIIRLCARCIEHLACRNPQAQWAAEKAENFKVI